MDKFCIRKRRVFPYIAAGIEMNAKEINKCANFFSLLNLIVVIVLL
jgi:hypothetical protein